MKISEETLNKIMNYLANRPFAEVFQLISIIQDDVKKNNQPETNDETSEK